jgi:bacterioferritin-associated ferredoxin
MDLDRELCLCFHVSARKVVNFVRRTRPPRASMISECFSAGTGCGWCIPFLRKIHRDVLAGAAPDLVVASKEEYSRLRGRYLADVQSGLRERHTRDRDALPSGVVPCLDNSDRPCDGSSCAGETLLADRARGSVSSEPTPSADDWDVSDYFSRPSVSDPEPETLSDPEV